jgi:hypothetical protein
VFIVLFAAILARRVSLELARDELESLKAEARVTSTQVQHISG